MKVLRSVASISVDAGGAARHARVPIDHRFIWQLHIVILLSIQSSPSTPLAERPLVAPRANAAASRAIAEARCAALDADCLRVDAVVLVRLG